MKVTLRQRTLKTGKVQLYLDYYGKGKRFRENLELYLTGDRKQDKATQTLASAIRAQKELEMKNDEHGFTQTFKRDASFLAFVAMIRDSKNGNIGVWESALYHLEQFTGGKTFRFRDVTPEWLEGFKFYLGNHVSPNTARGYYAVIREALKRAVNEGIIPSDPSAKVDNIRGRDTHRSFLTQEELQSLANAPCADPEVRRAFLFACYTGLRLSDIRALQWKNVHKDQLELVQKKTKEPVYIPLNAGALKLLGTPGNATDPMFYMPGDSHLSVIMKTWTAGARITKRITFHCSRHTFATLAITSGAELYTVSKLLGHSRLETTQVYAKIIDSKKRDAVNLLPEIEV